MDSLKKLLLVFLLGYLAVAAKSLRFCYGKKLADYYLSLPTSRFYWEATGGRRIGRCFIQVSGGPGAACYLYAKSAYRGHDGDYGWPKTTDWVGTGCVRAPNLPKRVTTCYYRDPRYRLSWALINKFCTNDGVFNAVNQLKHAIRNEACAISSSPPSYYGCIHGVRGCWCTRKKDSHPSAL